MSDGSIDDDPTVPGTEPTREVTARFLRRRATEEQLPHSTLVGFMSVRVHRWLPVRRSTLLMAIAFLAFGTWCYFYPPYSAPSGGSTGTSVIPGVVPATTTTTTTTVPPTTTTVPPTTTTSTVATTTTTRPPGTTTTTARTSGTTTTTTSPTLRSATTTTAVSTGGSTNSGG